MRRPLRTVSVVAAATVLSVVVTWAFGPRPAVVDDARTGDLRLAEQALEAVGGRGLNGLAVAVVEPGAPGGVDGSAESSAAESLQVRTAGAGTSRTTGAPVDAGTAFEIGSVTKPMTGHLLAELAHEGVVDPDAPLADLVPGHGLAETGAATPAELAVHRSGLPRLQGGPSQLARALLWPFGVTPYAGTAGQVLDRAGRDGVPGDGDPVYSNYGAAVLGNALAASGGTTYADLLQERLLDPLAMTSTVVASRTDELPQRRAGGSTASGRLRDPWLAEGWQPAGVGTWSTAEDLARWLAATMEGVAPGSAAAQPRAALGEDEIGYFWLTSVHEDRTITWHNGAVGGSTAFVGFDREARVGLVLLSDTSTPTTAGAMDLLVDLARHPGSPGSAS